MTLLQCSFEVVISDVGVETGPSKGILYPSTVSCTMCVSFYWVRMSQTMRKYVTLAAWGTSFLWIKNKC